MRFLGTIAAWLTAAALAYVLGSIASTQVVLSGIEALGRDVPFGVNLRTTLADLAAMLSYLLVILIGFAVAFFVADLVKALIPVLTPIAYPVAGGLAIFTALSLMEWRYGVVPILGAQSDLGFWLQIGAGVLGGILFELLRPKSREERQLRERRRDAGARRR